MSSFYHTTQYYKTKNLSGEILSFRLKTRHRFLPRTLSRKIVSHQIVFRQSGFVKMLSAERVGLYSKTLHKTRATYGPRAIYMVDSDRPVKGQLEINQ